MKEMKQLPYARQRRILEQLNKLDRNECLKIDELAKDFNVSSMTIYRDLVQLEKSGEVLRVYGGVKAARQEAQEEDLPAEELRPEFPVVLPAYGDSTIEERFYRQIEAKRAIARAAAGYVQDGDAIAIDPSTTTLHMCSYLQEKRITVVTTSMSVVLQFAASKTVDVIMVGGFIRKSALSVVGSLLSGTLSQIHINKCFLSSHGFTYRHGLTDMTMEECDAKKQLLKRSNEVNVLLDPTKLNKYAPFVVCEPGEIDRIITVRETLRSPERADILNQCAQIGCEVVCADPDYETGEPVLGN